MSAFSFFSHYWPQKTQERAKMNGSLFRVFRVFRGQPLILSALLVFTTAHAQNANAPGQVKKADPGQQAAAQVAFQNGMTEAKALAKLKNLNALEAKLATLNHAKPNTAAWHIELAQRLVQVADSLAREGSTEQVASVATSALQHLTQADGLTSIASVRGSAKSLSGFIQERYLGDTAQALMSYNAAVQLAPDSKRAAEAAGRLQRNADNLRAKDAGK
jgi:hypothetical protein